MGNKMTEEDIRMKRIERLLYELKYEVTRGILEHDIGPRIGFTFQLPYKDQVIHGEFRTRLHNVCDLPPITPEPRLKSV